MYEVMGASIFPTGAATDITTAVTTAISENVGVVLTVLGFFLGLNLVIRLFNRGTHGRL